MPNPYKQQIRDAAATVLASVLGSAASIYKHRVRNFAEADLPAVNLIVSSERNDLGSMSSVGITATLAVEIRVANVETSTESPVLVAEALESQVRAALDGGDLGIDGVRVRWDNDEPPDAEDEAETPILLLETTFAVELRVAEGDDTTIIS